MNSDELATLANSLIRVKALLNWDLAALAANHSGSPKAVTLQQHGTQPELPRGAGQGTAVKPEAAARNRGRDGQGRLGGHISQGASGWPEGQRELATRDGPLLPSVRARPGRFFAKGPTGGGA